MSEPVGCDAHEAAVGSFVACVTLLSLLLEFLQWFSKAVLGELWISDHKDEIQAMKETVAACSDWPFK